MAFEIPHSCTLPTAERPVRLAEFDTLLGSATSAKRADQVIVGIRVPDEYASILDSLQSRAGQPA